MGCDMVVALPPATGNDQTLFGANAQRPWGEALTVKHTPGRSFAAGETLAMGFVQVPQVRNTAAVLAFQTLGSWGYLYGVNEHRVAVGCSDWQSRRQRGTPGLLGPELVRLTLERACGARQGLEVLTDLIGRHGQGGFPGSPEGEDGDHVFLVADPTEAFAVEAAGSAWAAQEIRHTRAASDVGIIRQDWYRLAPGLADLAIAEGWWSGDGSKIDFTGALSEAPAGKASALRRWGRATLLMEQQSGHIDAAWLRQLLADHYEGTHFEVDPVEGRCPVTPLCQHAWQKGGRATAASLVAQLPSAATTPTIVWAALGPPCVTVHLPVVLEGELPQALCGETAEIWAMTHRLGQHLGTDAPRWSLARATLARLQTRFEQDIEEFLTEAARLEKAPLERLAGSLMQGHVERYEECVRSLLEPKRAVSRLASAAVGEKDNF